VHGYGRAKVNYHWPVYPMFLNPFHKNFCIARGQDSGPGLCEYSIPWFIVIGNGHFAIPAWLTIICFQTLFLA